MIGWMSSAGSNLLAAFRPTGWPRLAPPPSRTASTKLGSARVPSSLLKTEMQFTVHSSVAALATPVAATLAQAMTPSVVTAVSSFVLSDNTWVRDEVMMDLLSEDLTAPIGDETKPAR